MNQKVALVLSSGGARGMAHIGVIEQLTEMGFEISSISGTSIGSLVGGLYSSGHLEKYKDWILNFDKSDVFNFMDFQLKSHGFIKGHKVFSHMEDWLDDYQMENLPIPFTAIACDIMNRKEVVFNSGNLSEAIRASVAVPGFVAPVERDGNLLFDGGVVNPLPLNRVKRHKNDILIAVDLNAFVEGTPMIETEEEDESVFLHPRLQEILKWYNERFGKDEKEEQKKDLSYFTLINQMFDLMQEEISRYSLKETPPDVLIKIPRDICGTFDFHKSPELIEIGRKMAKDALEAHLEEKSKKKRFFSLF